MKRVICILILVLSYVLFAANAYADECVMQNGFLVNQLLKKIDDKADAKLVEIQKGTNGDWALVEFDYYADEYPITINVLVGAAKRHGPVKIMYMIAPSGQNFKNVFFVPTERNIAQFLRKSGYIVVGITFPEDSIPASEAGAFLSDWGLDKHRRDIEKAVRLIGRILPYGYDMLGQASSAVCIMDYASRNAGKLNKIILLDTDSFDPEIRPEKVRYAAITYDAMKRLIDGNVYSDNFATSIKQLVYAGTFYPAVDSGVPRSFVGLPGNFTFDGLLHFSLVYAASLPGIHTPISGLPGEWVMIQGLAAGFYEFSVDPALDSFGLTRTKKERIFDVVSLIGEGTSPIALGRDIYGLLSLDDNAYRIHWENIDEKVVMVNGQYSSGEQTYYGTLIKRYGNPDVRITVVPDYAYLDLLYAEDAEADVWPLFLK